VAFERYESAGVFDVNGDGLPNIVSGAYWYETPDNELWRFISAVSAYGERFYEFCTIPIDVRRVDAALCVLGGQCD